MSKVQRRSGRFRDMGSAAALVFFAEWLRGACLIAFLPDALNRYAGGGAALAGLAVSAHYLADSGAKLIAGYWLDRRPAKTVLAVGWLLAAGGFALTPLTGFAWMTVVSAGLMGIGLSPVWLVGVRQVKEEGRAERMGFLYAFWLAGLGLGPVAMNVLLDAGSGLGIAAIAFSLAAGLLTAGLGRFAAAATEPARRTPAMEQWRTMRDSLKRNRMLVPAIVMQTMGAGMIAPFLSSFASQRLALTRSELSLVMAIGGACVILLLVPMGKWYDAIKSRWFLAGGFGLFAASLAGLTAVRSLAGAGALVAAMGLGYAMLLPAWNALLAQHVPARSPNMGWGVLSTLEGAGVVFGPLVGSWAVAKGSLSAPFLLGAGLYGLIGLSYFLMPADLFGERRSPAEAGNA